MRKRTLLRGFPVWLFVISLLFTGITSTNAQKAERLSKDEVKTLLKEATKPVSKSSKGLSIFYEGFDGTEIPAGWSQTGNGTDGWVFDDDAEHWWDASVNCDDWLISSAITLGDLPTTIGFWQFGVDVIWSEGHGVYVSASADMSDSVLIYDGIPSEQNWEYVMLSLDDWLTETIYIGFNYKGFYADLWVVDDVNVDQFDGPFENYLEAYSFDALGVPGTINQTDKTVLAMVPFATDVADLTASFTSSMASTVKVGTTMQVSGETTNDFTNAVVYTVSDYYGVTRDYSVMVEKAEPLVSFGFAGADWVDMYNDTIEVYMAANYDATKQVGIFTMYDAAYVLKNGTTELTSGVTEIDASSAVTLTAVAGDYSKTYTLILTQEDPLWGLEFVGFMEDGELNDVEFPAYAYPNSTDMTVLGEVPFGADRTKLVVKIWGEDYISSATFKGTAITDGDVVDFSVAGDLVVNLAAPTKASELTYAVTIENAAASDKNEILDIDIDNLADDLVWDVYGRKIEGVLMYDSTKNILPLLTISNFATVDTSLVAFDMPASGDTTLTYKVTSESGVVGTWLLNLTVEEPSGDAELTDFVFVGQNDGWFNEDADTLLLNLVASDFDLTKVEFSALEVSFGATFTPTTVSGTVIDYTNQPVIYTVTAQDGVTKTEYATYIFPEETDLPVVSLTAGTYGNFDETVDVKVLDASTLLGMNVVLLHKDMTVADLMTDFDQVMADGKVALVEAAEGTTDSIFQLPTDNLIAGIYYAYAGDVFENISLASVDSAVIAIDTVDVETLEDMMYANVVYKYTGEAVVTYAETGKKWMQDATMGILVDDASAYVSDTVKIGDALTGIYGKLVDMDGMMKFQPLAITKDSAMVVSRENVVEAMELSVEEFMDDNYEYQNMLVKLNNMSFTQADASNYFTNGATYTIEDNVTGDMTKFRTTFADVDFIGDTIPYGVFNIVGIKNISAGVSVISARSYADIMEITGSEFVIDPEMWDVSMIGVADDMKTFTVSNMGTESFTIVNAFIEGAPEFNMVNIYDVEVDGFNSFDFDVSFEPADFGSYESVLKITLDNGDVHEVTLTASVKDVPLMDYPYASNFDKEEDIAGWIVENYGVGAGFQWGNSTQGNETNAFYRVGYNNPEYAKTEDAMLISPPIDMTNAIYPVIEWDNTMVNAWASTATVVVSIDEKQTWTTIATVATTNYEITPFSFDISEYAGNSRVYFGFYLVEPAYSYNTPITWWDIDNFELSEFPVIPVFAINADSIGMGYVDGSMSEELVIANEGSSYFTLNSVTLKTGSSAAFTLTNVPATAVDVYNQEIVVNVNFDGTLAMQEATVLVDYTDVRNGNTVLEIPVSAFGVGCAAPIAAVEGANEAPYAPSWFSFTPANNALITVSSCGDVVDTDLKVFKGCDGILVAANDDSGCPNYASEVSFPAEGGVTYMINWVPTWSADGFTFDLMVEDLPTAPVLLTAEASALNATTGKVVLTFEDMIELIPAKKGVANVYSTTSVDKFNKESTAIAKPLAINYSKTFVPDGDDEEEPNNSNLTAKVITVGTEDAPAKITGLMGVDGDEDWFAIPVSEIGFYFDITVEVEAGSIDMWLLYWNEAEQGWYGNPARDITADEPGALSYTQYDNGTDNDTVYIWINGTAAAAPGYGYNLKVWSSAPPTFSVYRDNLKIAGPESMAFSYIDQGIKLNQEYCYSVTQELYNGSESELSNSICVTATAGTGDICTKSVEVGPGLNTTPKSPYWFTYTPTESKMVTISSNIEENGDPGEDWNDTWLFIYANCDDETPIYENDDVVNGTIRTSELQFAVEAGETYLIHWRRWAPEGEDNAYDAEPFFFTIVEEDMLAGDIVETAIPVTLPLVDMAGTTKGFNHDYEKTACDYIFMEGNDVAYTFSVPYGGTITGGIEGVYAGMHVIKGKPGSDACIAFVGGANGGTFTDQAIDAGEYYIIVSSKIYQSSKEMDFVMNLAFTPAAKQTVTFNVDMNTQITLGNFDPANDTVDVVGTFNLWERTADMTDADGDGVYTYALPTEFFVGEVLKYKYRINGDWDKAEFSSDIYGAREYTVLTADNVTDDLFNDEATPTFDVTFKVVMTRQKELGNFDDAANKVGLNSSTGDVAELVDADGTLIYATTVSADYGEVITYNFNIDGTAEAITARTTNAIMENTVITVWYNNDDAVNVSTDLAATVSVYPNPATTDFTVDFGTVNTENTVAQIVDLSGQVIKSIELNNRSLINIDASEYAKGVYYLKLTNGESVSVQKVVIQ